MLFSSLEINKLNTFKQTSSLLNELNAKLRSFEFAWFSRNNKEVLVDIKVVLNKSKKYIIMADSFFDSSELDFNYILNFIDLYNNELISAFQFESGDSAQRIVSVLFDLFDRILRETSFEKFLINSNKFNLRDEFVNFVDYLRQIVSNDIENISFKKIGNNSQNNNFIDNRLNKIEERLNKFEANVIVETQNILNKYSVKNDEKVKEILDDLELYIGKFKTEKLPNLESDIENINKEIGNTKVKLVGLVGNLDQYESIISENTENEISKHYSLKADKERNTYWLATSITASIIIASLSSAWFGLHDYYQNYVSSGPCFADSIYMDDNYKKCVEGLNRIRESTQKFALNYLVMRLIFSVLLFLTVIYTSRIAIRAYSHWRHSESMHLKLASLRPFINQLETKERDQIHKDLVPDYFGKDAGLVDSTNEKFKDLPANVSAVAMKAIEQISGNGNSSGTEKNTNNQSTGTQ